MDPIMRRLFESKKVISTEYFNLPNNAEEHWDLLDILEMALRNARDKLFDDVDIDDTGMNGYGDVKGDRTIIFQAELYHSQFDGKSAPKKIPLTSKEWKSLESELLSTITLPKEDDQYEYEVSCSYESVILKIKLKRSEI